MLICVISVRTFTSSESSIFFVELVAAVLATIAVESDDDPIDSLFMLLLLLGLITTFVQLLSNSTHERARRARIQTSHRISCQLHPRNELLTLSFSHRLRTSHILLQDISKALKNIRKISSLNTFGKPFDTILIKRHA